MASSVLKSSAPSLLAVPSSALQSNPKSSPLSGLRFHYNALDDSDIKEILGIIIDELLSHECLHDWDDSDPVKELATIAKSEVIRIGVKGASYMVNFNIVQEVHTIDGSNRRIPVLSNPSDVAGQLFPSAKLKVRTLLFLESGNLQFYLQDKIAVSHPISQAAGNSGSYMSQGRIV